MPGTILGTGTRHIGKGNILSELDTCAHCGRRGELASYDTELVFCLFALPILRLGQRRILRQCPSCGGHQALDRKEWDRLRETELGPLIHLALHDRADATKAIRLLRALLRLHSENRFLQFAALHPPHSVEVPEIARLFAAGFRRFDRREREELYLRRCLELRGHSADDERALTDLLIDVGRWDEAIQRTRQHLAAASEEDAHTGRRLLLALHRAGLRREASRLGKEFAPALARARHGQQEPDPARPINP